MSDMATICIVGQGYVGLPLGLAFDEEDFEVIGYDISEEKIDTLSDGRDPTGDHADETIAASGVEFTTDASTIERAEFVIVTVPTPVMIRRTRTSRSSRARRRQSVNTSLPERRSSSNRLSTPASRAIRSDLLLRKFRG